MSRLTLTRRQILKALGFTSLAALPVFRPGILHAQSATSIPKRFVGVATFSGTQPSNFWPAGDAAVEALGELPPLLAPLEAFKSKINVIKGMRLEASLTPGGSHTRGQMTLFSGMEPKEVDGLATWKSGGGPTMDHYLAQTLQPPTRFRSLYLGVVPWYGRISWRGEHDYVDPMGNPYETFDQVFGDIAADSDPAALAALRARRKSVLDHVSGELSALMPALPSHDRPRIEQHLQSVREIESRLLTDAATCSEPMLGQVIDHDAHENAETVSKLQIDILAASFACDVSHYALLQYSKGTTPLTFPFLGIPETGHDLSHARDSETALQDKLFRVLEWYGQQVAYLLEKLDALPAGDGGSVLDHSVVMWGSENGKGNSHTLNDIPIVLAGGAGGFFETGRILRYERQPHNDVLVSVAQAMGVETDVFGNPAHCNGGLSELRA